MTRDHTRTHSGDKAGSEWKPHLFCERATPWVLPLPSLLPTPEAKVLAVTEGTRTAVCPAHPAPSRQQCHLPANKTRVLRSACWRPKRPPRDGEWVLRVPWQAWGAPQCTSVSPASVASGTRHTQRPEWQVLAGRATLTYKIPQMCGRWKR